MKTLLKIVLGLVVVVGAGIGLVFWLTADLPRAADAFLTRIAANDYDGALALTTPDFRASTDRAALEAFARSNGLDSYKSATWTSRQIENSSGQLEGTLTLASGEVPISISLVKDDGGWKIQKLNKAAAGLSPAPAPATPAPEAKPEPASEAPAAEESAAGDMPDEAAQQQLVADTLHAFAASINGDDFGILHQTAAQPFQDQISVDTLRTQFEGFVEEKVDLSVLDTLTPAIDSSSAIDANGILHLTGSYPTKPSRVNFDLQYMQEDGEWKLVSINVQVG